MEFLLTRLHYGCMIHILLTIMHEKENINNDNITDDVVSIYIHTMSILMKICYYSFLVDVINWV